ncbi:MAG: acyl-CoA thioesterase/bile acid-CoA:amino acid N-acyltransferase family protein [PVC group bacterium]
MTDTGEPAPEITVRPEAALVDETVIISLAGFQPGESVTVRAGMTDARGVEWEAHAVFRANARGELRTGEQAPLSGTYRGRDPMGLFWSMVSPGGESYHPSLEPAPITIRAETETGETVSTVFRRLSVTPGVARIELREDGLIGEFFVPEGDGPAPAVLAVGGSAGGLRWSRGAAALLASRGYAALALAYFGLKGLPPTLKEIPLEYFQKAIGWLEKRPETRSGTLRVIGVSKGGELALLLGSVFPAVTGVAAFSGSGLAFNCLDRAVVSSWTFRGKPIPFVPFADASFFSRADFSRPLRFTGFYLDNMKNPDDLRAAGIPVEKINGPVFLVSGGDDGVWPAGQLAGAAVRRLKEHHHPVTHLHYPDAGHLTRYPFLPTTSLSMRMEEMGLTLAFGGSPAANHHAAADAWPRLLDFLEQGR